MYTWPEGGPSSTATARRGSIWSLTFDPLIHILPDFLDMQNYRGKLGNGEHLSLEASKYKEYNIYVPIIMQHKEHIKFYPETHFYRHNISR